ncbi:hypothetical protein NPIL_370661 [Nephila pilipes]|uniref:Uncharacterized protein n=1 Tax=Nephila pilipes TaxID=299642 RepID=A0A8X6U512_NEPPI|nr:hypothetical protein NPIL_370661 [Nephila pilipes]
MPLKFLTEQQALDKMETSDLDEFSIDENDITCLPPGPGQITDEENFNENYLDEVESAESQIQNDTDIYSRKIKAHLVEQE